MRLPGPLRAAIGLAATAKDEARRLPERALELPMLAVSSALQISLRAQQRYARLTARGDEVLRGQPGDEPPEWATFDDSPSASDLRDTAFDRVDGHALGDVRSFADLFAVSDPVEPAAPPASPPTAKKSPAAKKGPARAPAKAAEKAPAKAAKTARKTPAKRTAAPPAPKTPAKKAGRGRTES
jgi:hypothetical protein